MGIFSKFAKSLFRKKKSPINSLKGSEASPDFHPQHQTANLVRRLEALRDQINHQNESAAKKLYNISSDILEKTVTYYEENTKTSLIILPSEQLIKLKEALCDTIKNFEQYENSNPQKNAYISRLKALENKISLPAMDLVLNDISGDTKRKHSNIFLKVSP